MKIKDVTGERSFTILKDVIPYIEKFAKNSLFQNIFSPDGMPETAKEQTDVIYERISENLPELIFSAKDDFVGYFALLEGKTPEEYAKDISLGKISNGITDMFSDEHFMIFFKPLLKKATSRD